ncbi:MAG: hypothetical protein R3Y11_07880 [Pseudomonadota bacterium]
MTVFCKRIRKRLSDEECLERIKGTINIKPLKVCRGCIDIYAEGLKDQSMVHAKLFTLDERCALRLERQRRESSKKRDVDMLTLPPSRFCHTCGVPSHDWECKTCQAKRHEKGA